MTNAHPNPTIHNFKRGKYSCDDSIFNVLTNEAAYWIGFLAADAYFGCGGKNQIQLCLGAKDKEHLEQFRNFISATNPISMIPQYGTYRLSVSSRTMFEHLTARGIAIKKAARSPNAELIRSSHFWRGVIDGDGWWHIRPNGGLSCGIVTCSPAVVNGLLEFAQKRIGFRGRIRSSRVSLRLEFGGDNALMLAVALYKNSTVHLPRKHRTIVMALAENRKHLASRIAILKQRDEWLHKLNCDLETTSSK